MSGVLSGGPRRATVAAATNRQILLVDTPKGKLGPQHFRLREGEMPSANDGEGLLRGRYISLHPPNRARMQGATYRDPREGGSAVAGGAGPQVGQSKAPAV